DLVERLNECEYSFNSQYDLIENVNKINRKENSSRSLLYAHSDKYHDFNWILHVYSLDDKSKSFIKYLSSMTFSTKSSLWNDIELKGILSYKTISSIQSSNKTNVSRKLFQSNTTDQLTNKLTINRSKSDGIVENNDKKHIKLSPYTKLYEYVLSHLDHICYRLYGSQSNKFERIIWNLFENYTQLLFCSRLIQVYKSECLVRN
ncbi:unnamed protein product, partial [Rotaria sp. Silwood1]